MTRTTRRQTSQKRPKQDPTILQGSHDVSPSRSTPSKRARGRRSTPPGRKTSKDSGAKKTAAPRDDISDIQNWITQLWDDSSTSCQVLDGGRLVESDLYGDDQGMDELRREWALRPWANAATMVQIALQNVKNDDDDSKSKDSNSDSNWSKRVLEISRMALADKRLQWDHGTARTYMNALSECGVMLLQSRNDSKAPGETTSGSSAKMMREVINSFGLRRHYSHEVTPQIREFLKKPFREDTSSSNTLGSMSKSLEQCLCVTGLLQVNTFIDEHADLPSDQWVRSLRSSGFEFDLIGTAAHSFFNGDRRNPNSDSALFAAQSCCTVVSQMVRLGNEVFGKSCLGNDEVLGEIFRCEYLKKLFLGLAKPSIQSHFSPNQSSGMYILPPTLYFSLLYSSARVIEELNHTRQTLATVKADPSGPTFNYLREVDETISKIKDFLESCPLPKEVFAWIHSNKTFASLSETERGTLDRIIQLATMAYKRHFGSERRSSISERLFSNTVCTEITSRLVFQDSPETTSPPSDVEPIRLLWSLWDRHTTDHSAEPSTISTGQENQEYLGSTPLFFTDIGGDGPLGQEANDIAQNTHEALDELLQNTEDRAPENHQPEVESGSDESDSN